MTERPDWPWQVRGVAETISLLDGGERSICLTAPTGMGKGKMIERLSRYFIDGGGRVILFINRKMLTRQTGERLTEAGITFGYASAEHGINTDRQMIVASVQTLTSRIKRETMELPAVDLVLIDEAHNRGFDKMIAAYRELHPQAAIVGLTATPVGLNGKYAQLLTAGTKREGRQHGALVPCLVFAPSEPDMRGVQINKVGEYVHDGMVKRVMQCTAFADVLKSWKLHVKDDRGLYRPTLLWAPGVPESRWFVEQFTAQGVTAAHVDGETPDDERERIRIGSRDGTIQIVSSYGVLREGVDWPWISYGILVQVCGALETFLQTVGRILRAYAGKRLAILQDHSGTWWRHGSPNEDIEWQLGDTNQSLAKQRKKDIQAGKRQEGICCPKCSGIRAVGPRCPHCGYEHTKSVRMVKMTNGELVKMTGPVVKKKKIISESQKLWTSCLYRCGATGRTLQNAAAMYTSQAGGWLPGDCTPQPPKGDLNWGLKVHEVYKYFGKRKAKV